MHFLNNLKLRKFWRKEQRLPYYTTDKLTLPNAKAAKAEATTNANPKAKGRDCENQWEDIELNPGWWSWSKTANFFEAVQYCVGRVVATGKHTHERFLFQHPMRRAILITIVFLCAVFLILACLYHGLRYFAEMTARREWADSYS
ncbi:hypothetical protein PG997_014941 [Apiospora hydei]|uniref:Uncharacterized protein n=1 Tax=Apiospora hydei TaxID=1337664 RepID=A0ABR1UV77_9PEZI